jgi:tripartite-type tricarboxylate transporter receptor subunit TctC
MKMPEVTARMTAMSASPVGGDADRLGRLISADFTRYGRVVKQFGIQAD